MKRMEELEAQVLNPNTPSMVLTEEEEEEEEEREVTSEQVMVLHDDSDVGEEPTAAAVAGPFVALDGTSTGGGMLSAKLGSAADGASQVEASSDVGEPGTASGPYVQAQ